VNSHPTHFYDSASPHNIPSGVYAAVCINGRFAWQEHDIQRMAKVFRYIAVEHDGKASIEEWAQEARGVDIEPGCVWPPERAVPFLVERHKRNGDATAYCDRSTLPTIQRLMHGIPVLYWVATLDGTQNVPGSWAVQYHGGMTSPFDISVLHGADTFHRP
jgi:hypothetical protein